MALDISADLVGKGVELFFAQGVVGTGIGFGSSSECFDFILGWCFHVSFLNLVLNSGSEFFLGDLTVVVGVNGIEDLVGFFVGDTFFSFGSDLDGSGGGDEGDKGEFHFSFVLFCFLIIAKFLRLKKQSDSDLSKFLSHSII